jgi:glycerate 2-kinase
MNILIAPDSFKDSLSAVDVTYAVQNGIKSVREDAAVIPFPMADGGEGTTEIIKYHIGGMWHWLEIHDPLQRKINSNYLLLKDRNSAVIELAKASGLELLHPQERNPLHTTTLGTGELIRDALDRKMDNIILTIGGSATVDAGTGIAAALGFRFYDKTGKEILPTGGTLSEIYRIDADRVHNKFKSVRWTIASDVQNFLNGPEGAAKIYGPQKGADQKAVEILAEGLEHISFLIKKETGFSADNYPGTGAAGGAALFLMAYGTTQLQPGFDILAGLTDFQPAIESADIVISGEGRIDEQTKYGKVIFSIARYTANIGKPLIVVCGIVEGDSDTIRKSLGITEIFTISSRAQNKADSLSNARSYLREIGADIARRYVP